MKKDILTKVMINSPEIHFDRNSKIAFISDCHRGDGTYKDDLMPNANIYMTALNYYYRNNFTYIEIGDGDELWKVKNIEDIYNTYPDIFKLLLKFKCDNRLYMLYGNHDEIKATKKFKHMIDRIDRNEEENDVYNLFHDLTIYEGLILNYENLKKLFVIHGHQVDKISNNLEPFASFLVRYVWSFLEGHLGFKNGTSPARSNTKRKKVDKKLQQWVKLNNQPIVAGHTHRSRLPQPDEIPYFNDGCCIHPYSVSSIEIEKGNISLIKWSIKSLENGVLTVRREIIGGPEPLINYKII
jgi:UDP-2,3-diacylglucosamine pyrophosphatase LpxH